MTHFTIKIVSDTVCPWCYLGKKRLDRAIDLYRQSRPDAKDDTFAISFSPFYLNPDAPKIGVPIEDYLAGRFGPARVKAMHAQMKALGLREGINYTFQGRAGNTRDSHRLVRLGQTKGNDAELRVVSQLFRSYFENGGDITSHDTLVAAAAAAGIDAAEARDWLASDAGGADVDRAVAEANRLGIHGVPHFTIQDRHELSGAQDPQVFVDAFNRIKNSAAGAAPAAVSGDSC
ncbi:hypothetical protein HK405_001411 [Cladochytrium tenue]|nr:hypothetical protein HK405_001411 [Cladochytrium tenue]